MGSRSFAGDPPPVSPEPVRVRAVRVGAAPLVNIFATTVWCLEVVRENAMTKLDIREMAPPERHPKIFEAFEDIESGEALTLVNDHEPTPLYHQMAAEDEEFDAENYTVDRVGPNEFVATLPKK
jgi:uncharacterized protein (DUF2249 family)